MSDGRFWKKRIMLLFCIQRWAQAYRTGCMEIVAGTNNGIESHHKIFKKSYLNAITTYNLTSMLQILVNDFLPARYRKWVSKGSFDKLVLNYHLVIFIIQRTDSYIARYIGNNSSYMIIRDSTNSSQLPLSTLNFNLIW